MITNICFDGVSMFHEMLKTQILANTTQPGNQRYYDQKKHGDIFFEFLYHFLMLRMLTLYSFTHHLAQTSLHYRKSANHARFRACGLYTLEKYNNHIRISI